MLLSFDLLDLLTQRSTVSVRRNNQNPIVRASCCFEFRSRGIAMWAQAGRISYLTPYLPAMPTSGGIISIDHKFSVDMKNILLVRFVILAGVEDEDGYWTGDQKRRFE